MSCPTTAQAANKRLPAGSPKKTPPLFSGGVFHDRVCKPGSVIDSHLSRRTVAGALQPPSRKQPGKPCFLCGVAPDRVYSNGRFHTPLGALLPHLSTLAGGGASRLRRFISVALFLRSLWAGVTRYPCPAEPGLSSRAAFRRARATVWLTHLYILLYCANSVNVIEIFA